MPTDATKLASLVNEDNVRRSIKRLFTGTVPEILSELFQNSQRAQAAKVEMALEPLSDTAAAFSFTYTDDGHGLKNGVEGLHTLLRIAESGFDGPTIKDQDPMGLGIHSLLASSEVIQVAFMSGGVGVMIDTNRWWNDPDYYSTWFERVFTSKDPDMGLSIAVLCSKKFSDDIYTSTNTLNWQAKPQQSELVNYPARGYKGVLEIDLNGEPIDTSVPTSASPLSAFHETTFKGCRLFIGADSRDKNRYDTKGGLVVNWYGQLVTQDINLNHVGAYLEVTSGRPVNPMSPTRRGVIEDPQLQELIDFIRKEYFKAALDTANRNLVSANVIENCFRLDNERATRESPYFLAYKIEQEGYINGCEDIDKTFRISKHEYGNGAVAVKDKGITVCFLEDGSASYTDRDQGLSLFLTESEKTAYVVGEGDKTRIQFATPIWEPGEQIKDGYEFYKPGRWGFGYENEAGDLEVDEWFELDDNTNVVAFDYVGTNITYCEYTAGTSDIFEFLDSEEPMAMLDRESGDNWDCAEDNWNESIAELKRELLGNAVSSDFKLDDLERFFDGGRILKIELTYDKNSNYANRPASLTVTGTTAKTHDSEPAEQTKILVIA